ncbi:hypothetical protein CKO31_08055 [Thiohalocapsa halophila]|uniref:Choline transporter n=1 Tax=Thiohalocapsa halophila TaxID=69359 RepID=A0ABS1CFL0_9GAMM|nr:BCCT family transporter [Thiohalocapsa halophila]MBK1630696.1 hypothetical protein [Thiohalocapsa halophila]
MSVKNWSYRINGKTILDLNPFVFVGSSIIILAFVAGSFVWLDVMEEVFNAVQAWIANTTGWFFVLAINVILIYVIYLGFSRFGRRPT